TNARSLRTRARSDDAAPHKLKAVLDKVGAHAEVQFLPGKTHGDLYWKGKDRDWLEKQIAWAMYHVARPDAKIPAAYPTICVRLSTPRKHRRIDTARHATMPRFPARAGDDDAHPRIASAVAGLHRGTVPCRHPANFRAGATAGAGCLRAAHDARLARARSRHRRGEGWKSSGGARLRRPRTGQARQGRCGHAVRHRLQLQGIHSRNVGYAGFIE